MRIAGSADMKVHAWSVYPTVHLVRSNVSDPPFSGTNPNYDTDGDVSSASWSVQQVLTSETGCHCWGMGDWVTSRHGAPGRVFGSGSVSEWNLDPRFVGSLWF
jgi:hypothetical protein